MLTIQREAHKGLKPLVIRNWIASAELRNDDVFTSGIFNSKRSCFASFDKRSSFLVLFCYQKRTRILFLLIKKFRLAGNLHSFI